MSKTPDDAQFLADQQAEKERRCAEHIAKEFDTLPEDLKLEVLQKLAVSVKYRVSGVVGS